MTMLTQKWTEAENPVQILESVLDHILLALNQERALLYPLVHHENPEEVGRDHHCLAAVVPFQESQAPQDQGLGLYQSRDQFPSQGRDPAHYLKRAMK